MRNDSTKPPRLGVYWPGHGGIYAGVARGKDGAPDYHLLVAEPVADRLDWTDAKRWAGTLEIDGHSDFSLPDRREQSLLYANVPELFAAAWYWSGEQFASNAGFAWFQSFDGGLQTIGHELYELRARAVRRLVIE